MLLIAAVVAAPVAAKTAKDVTNDRAPALDVLLACRGEADAARRLACFDGAASALATSIRQKDVVVVDKAQVRETRRSLFGFAIPDLGIFRSSGAGKDEEEQQLVSTVRAASPRPDGNWTVTLETGAVWTQTDAQVIARAPRAGDQVTIRRAALGSYFMRIGRQPGVKARREG